MPPELNRQVRLKSRPNGIPQSDHFEIVATELPEIADRQFLVRNDYLSVEPAMRGWVAAASNYSTPVGIGEVMRAFSAGTVTASRHPNYAEGDNVMGMLGWQEYAMSDGSSITRKVHQKRTVVDTRGSAGDESGLDSDCDVALGGNVRDLGGEPRKSTFFVVQVLAVTHSRRSAASALEMPRFT